MAIAYAVLIGLGIGLWFWVGYWWRGVLDRRYRRRDLADFFITRLEQKRQALVHVDKPAGWEVYHARRTGSEAEENPREPA